MKNTWNRFTRTFAENMVYLCFWLLMYLEPVISYYVRTLWYSDITFEWSNIFHIWRFSSFFFVGFLIHNFCLTRILFVQKKPTRYVVACLMLIAVMFTTQNILSSFSGRHTLVPPPPPKQAHVVPDERRMTGEPPAFPDDVNPFAEQSFAPDADNPDETINSKIRLDDFIIIVGYILLIAMNSGVKLYFKSIRDKYTMMRFERQNMEHQLEYLRYQVNPHFFMNTLNNIHALIDTDPEKAKMSIVRMSKMMRHVLHKGSKSQIPVQNEVAFIGDYIDLMRLRYNEKVDISLDIQSVLPDKSIPPLLLIIFIENAFKHGVSYKEKSFIHVSINADNMLTFVCENSKHPTMNKTEGGVGLKNVRQRLDILYGTSYLLHIADGDDIYKVTLTLPLSDMQPTDIQSADRDGTAVAIVPSIDDNKDT